MSDLTGNIEHT